MSLCGRKMVASVISEPRNDDLKKKDTTTPTVVASNKDYDDYSSIMEFLNQEQQANAFDNNNDSEVDIESLFEEINRLSTSGSICDTDIDRNVEDILREAEMLISKQELGQLNTVSTVPVSPHFKRNGLVKALMTKTISMESTPREMQIGGDLEKLDVVSVLFFI